MNRIASFLLGMSITALPVGAQEALDGHIKVPKKVQEACEQGYGCAVIPVPIFYKLVEMAESCNNTGKEL